MAGGGSACETCFENPEFACRRYGGKDICPRDEHAPLTFEGGLFWAATPLFQRQVRVGGMGGFIGFDAAPCLEILELNGVDRRIGSVLLTYYENGVAAAFAEKSTD